MNFIKQMERIKKIHLLIRTEKTGSQDVFAKKLQLSRSQLYNVLELIKSFDASIKYCKKKESYYSSKPFDLELKYSLKTIVMNKENRNKFDYEAEQAWKATIGAIILTVCMLSGLLYLIMKTVF